MTDWASIKAEYLNTDISTRALAEKEGVSYATLRRRAEKERWVDERKKHERKVSTRIAQKVALTRVDREADRITRLLSIGDTLAAKLEQAAAELDKTLAKHKRKTKTVEYGDADAKGKPTKEVIVEEEILEAVDAPIDRLGMQQLSAALKNLRDVALTGKTDQAAMDKVDKLLEEITHAAAEP